MPSDVHTPTDITTTQPNSMHGFGPRRKSSFLLPLGLSFCMHSLKYSKNPGKLSKATGTDRKYEHLEKLIPEIFKMSFFMKFKTSPHLPPYYSTEPMKYALRVILNIIYDALKVPWAPGCAQISILKLFRKIDFS